MNDVKINMNGCGTKRIGEEELRSVGTGQCRKERRGRLETEETDVPGEKGRANSTDALSERRFEREHILETK